MPCFFVFRCHPEERSDDKVPGVLCQGKDLALTQILLRQQADQNDKTLPFQLTLLFPK